MPCGIKYKGEITRFAGKDAFQFVKKAAEKMKEKPIIVWGEDLSDHGLKPCYLLLKPDSPIPPKCKIVNQATEESNCLVSY